MPGAAEEEPDFSVWKPWIEEERTFRRRVLAIGTVQLLFIIGIFTLLLVYGILVLETKNYVVGQATVMFDSVSSSDDGLTAVQQLQDTLSNAQQLTQDPVGYTLTNTTKNQVITMITDAQQLAAQIFSYANSTTTQTMLSQAEQTINSLVDSLNTLMQSQAGITIQIPLPSSSTSATTAPTTT
jgi:predicted PurR-regulated permease PerM